MNDSAVKVEGRPACTSCKKSLFGQVKFCPFCGEAQGNPRPAERSPSTDSSPSKLHQLNKSIRQAQADNTAAESPSTESPAAPPAPPASGPAAAPPKATEPKPKAGDPEPAKTSDLPKAAPPKPAAPSPSPTVVPPANPDTKPSGMMMWLWALILLGGAYWGWQAFLSPKEPDACQQALEGTAASMQGGNFAQAKAIALGAVARCTEASQDRAKTLLKAAEVALAAEEKCTQGLQLAGSQIAEGRLKLADRTLAALPGSCTGTMAQKAQIESNRSSAAEKLAEAQTQTTNGQYDAARTLVNEAERLDQDNATLARTRAAIAKAEVEAARAAEETIQPQIAKHEPSPVLAPELPPRTAPPLRPPVPVPTGPTQADLQLECSILVRSGERALSSNSYDIAMQSAREAQTAVANCPGARELFDRARAAKTRAQQGVVIN